MTTTARSASGIWRPGRNAGRSPSPERLRDGPRLHPRREVPHLLDRRGLLPGLGPGDRQGDGPLTRVFRGNSREAHRGGCVGRRGQPGREAVRHRPAGRTGRCLVHSDRRIGASPSMATGTRSTRGRSPRTAASRRRSVTTGRSGCGSWPPASRSASSPRRWRPMGRAGSGASAASAFTPDGRGLLFPAGGKLAMASPTTGRRLELPRRPPGSSGGNSADSPPTGRR